LNKIRFLNLDEANLLFEQLTKVFSNKNVHLKGKSVVINSKFLENKERLSEEIADFMIKHYEKQWLIQFLVHFCYFSLKEQKVLLDTIYSVIAGEREGLINDCFQYSREEMIKEELMNDGSFNIKLTASTDSIKKYFNRYYTLLECAVETALDEYKFELEYQGFVKDLRNYLHKKTPRLTNISVVHDEGYVIYDSNNNEIAEKSLKQLTDRALYHYISLNVKPYVIAPLLSLAPKQLNVYTDNQDEPLVKTLENIFLERITFYPLHKFFQSAT
jgi:putative sporulation protein YtxC